MCECMLLFWPVTCEVQRGRVASLCVPTVNVVRAAQLLHPCQTAFLSSVQQCSVSSQQVLDVSVPVFHQVQGRVPIPVLLGWVCSMLDREEANSEGA